MNIAQIYVEINLHIAFKQKYEFEFLANISRGLHSWKTRMLTKKALGGELEGGWHNEGWDGEWRRRWSWEINLVHCGPAASQPHQVPLSKKGGQGTEGAGRVMVIWHKVNRASIGRYDFLINLFLHSNRLMTALQIKAPVFRPFLIRLF